MTELSDNGAPEATVPADELYELLKSWRWMQDAQPEMRDREAQEFIRGYIMALEHTHADLNRVISRHE